MSSLGNHIATLKNQNEAFAADIERLRAELAGERDRAAAIEARLRDETIRAERAMADLAGEQAARRAEAKLAEMRDDDVTILREDHAAQLAQRDSELAAAQARADQATAELVALAQRLAAIAEGQTSSRDEVRSEPPRRGRLGRAWAWFLRN